jgi:tetratricopeptide (TPR) repeat protein
MAAAQDLRCLQKRTPTGLRSRLDESSVAGHGQSHSNTGTSFNKLAYYLGAQGRHEKAEPLYRKGLEIRLAALGEAHPDVATSYGNLAFNLQAQERREEGELLLRKAWEILFLKQPRLRLSPKISTQFL